MRDPRLDAPDAAEEVRHQADARIREPGDRPPEEVRPDADVAVGEQHEAVPRRSATPPTSRLTLALPPGLALVEDEGGSDSRVSVGDAPGDAIRGIVVPGEGEDDLVRLVVEAEERLQVLLELLVEAGERLDDRDGRRETRPDGSPRCVRRSRTQSDGRRRVDGRARGEGDEARETQGKREVHAVAAASPGVSRRTPMPVPRRRAARTALAVLVGLQQRLPGVEVLGPVKVAVGEVRQALPRDDRIELPPAADFPEVHEIADDAFDGSRGTRCSRTTRSSRAGGRRRRPRPGRGSSRSMSSGSPSAGRNSSSPRASAWTEVSRLIVLRVISAPGRTSIPYVCQARSASRAISSA